jgi:hypothetical protein
MNGVNSVCCLLSEMDKQTLADGADYEASTGYHRLKVDCICIQLSCVT